MKWLFAFFSIFFLWSCNPNKFEVDNLDTSTWKPVFALPLFTAELKVSDLLKEISKNSVIKVNETDGFMTLVLSTGTYTYKANELFSFPNINKGISFTVPNSVYPSSGEIVMTQSVKIPISQSNDVLYSLLLKSGMLTVTPLSSGTNGSFELSSTTVSRFGSPLKVLTPLGASVNVNLRDYEVRLSSGNELSVDVNLVLTGTPGSSVGNLTRDFTIGLKNLDPKLIKCFITPRSVADLSDTFKLDLFDLNNLEGGINFLDPIVRFYSQNSFGGEVKFTINEIGGINNGNEISTVTIPSGQNTLLVKKPNSVGEVTNETQEINVSESFEGLIRSSPNRIFYNNSISLNDRATSLDTNFIMDTSTVRIRGELELPLQMRFPEIDFEFERPIDMSNLVFNEIEYLKFQMEFFNKFPLELRFQCVFLDENDVPFDSLFSHGSTLFGSEPLDEYGRINNVTSQKTEIVVDQERGRSLSKAQKVRIKLGFNTANKGEEWVRFYDDYRLGIKCKILVKASPDL